jgi:hypothetical protein
MPENVRGGHPALFVATRNLAAKVMQAGLKGRVSATAALFPAREGLFVTAVIEHLPGRVAALLLATGHVAAFIGEACLQRLPSGPLAFLPNATAGQARLP